MSPNLEHEQVTVRRGRRSGLPLVIAIHSRALGPAVGGCRLRRYPDWSAGVADALRLSEAMTYKCAAAGLPFGGGKSVLVLDERVELTAALRAAALADLGEFIASFAGEYLAGPDVGTGPDDMIVLREHTRHVFCLPESRGGTGSSSGPTAIGVLAALRAGAAQVFGTGSVSGRRVVVVGFGSVGSRIATELAAAGATVLVSDVDGVKRDVAVGQGLAWVEPAEAMTTRTDILVPAAVGGVLSAATVPELRAALVVGPANNQLTEDAVAAALAARGITWIPDFVAGAGGAVYTLGREIETLSHDTAMKRVEDIGDTVRQLLDRARADRITPLRAALDLADRRLAAGTR